MSTVVTGRSQKADDGCAGGGRMVGPPLLSFFLLFAFPLSLSLSPSSEVIAENLSINLTNLSNPHGGFLRCRNSFVYHQKVLPVQNYHV